MPATTPGKKLAVVLVHGVGDTAPGQMLNAVAGPLGTVNPALNQNQHQELLDLPETDPATGEPVTFAVRTMRGGQPGTDEVVVAEVHWADQTRAGVDTHHFFASLIRFVYGLHHIAVQAALIPGRLGTALTALLRLALFLLLGPISALFLFEAVLYSVYLVFVPLEWDNPAWRVPGLVLSALLGVSAFLVGWTRRRPDRSVFWTNLYVVGLLVLLHVLLRMTGVADDWYDSLIPRLNVPKNTVPGEMPLVGLIIDEVLDKLLAATAVCIVLAGIVVLLGRFLAPRPVFASMWTAWLAAVCLVAAWELATRLIDLIAQRAYDKSRRTPDALYTVWANDGCLIALGLGLIVFTLATVVAFLVWVCNARAALDRGEPVDENPPRLIIAFAVRICLLVFACVLCPLAAFDGFGVWPQRWGYVRYEWVFLIFVVVGGVVLGWSRVFRNILHILNDIVVHFQTPGPGRLLSARRYDPVRYRTRARIARRLRSVIHHLLSESPAPTHLVILAHSQGTIIALEELRKRRWRSRFAGLESVTLITFGSPLEHVYEHYFPFLYPGRKHRRWSALCSNLTTWVNVFRIDDYVGRKIEPVTTGFPDNIELEPGLQFKGHTRYWEAPVFARLKQWLS